MKAILWIGAAFLSLTALVSTMLYAQGMRPHPPSPVQIMDTNRDGAVSQAEWEKFHKKLFSEIDKNHDGKLTDAEFRGHHEEMRCKKFPAR